MKPKPYDLKPRPFWERRRNGEVRLLTGADLAGTLFAYRGGANFGSGESKVREEEKEKEED